MRKCLARCTGWFFVSMLVLTLASWKLDELRTPQVVCVLPAQGQIAGKDGVMVSYDCIVPLEALHGGGESWYVYLAEDTNSCFSPITARRASVTILARTETHAAVSGIFSDVARVIRYASRPLGSDGVSVRIWEVDDG